MAGLTPGISSDSDWTPGPVQISLTSSGTWLFDFNFQAMGIDADECFELAYKRELKPGQHKKVYFAEHWRTEMAADAATRQAASPIGG